MWTFGRVRWRTTAPGVSGGSCPSTWREVLRASGRVHGSASSLPPTGSGRARPGVVPQHEPRHCAEVRPAPGRYAKLTLLEAAAEEAAARRCRLPVARATRCSESCGGADQQLTAAEQVAVFTTPRRWSRMRFTLRGSRRGDPRRRRPSAAEARILAQLVVVLEGRRAGSSALARTSLH